MKHSGPRLLLLIILLVSMVVTANGLDLFNAVEHDYVLNETNLIIVQEEVVSLNAYEIVAVNSVSPIEQITVTFITAGVYADLEADLDLLIGATNNRVPTLNADGFDLWGGSSLIAGFSKPKGLLRTLTII